MAPAVGRRNRTRAGRHRRDTAENIYAHCKAFGNCPTDVLNKIEQNTIADKILKYGSGAVFFGGLGIGGGAKESVASLLVRGIARVAARQAGIPATRYVPPVVTPRLLPPRPTVRLTRPTPAQRLRQLLAQARAQDAAEAALARGPGEPVVIGSTVGVLGPGTAGELGPGDILPIGADAPSLIELSDLAPGGEDVIIPAYPRVTEVQVHATGPPGRGSAILEMIPEPTEIVSRSQYDNPAFEVSVQASAPGETSAVDNVYVLGEIGGEHIGEEIPLRTIGPSRSEPSLIDETSFSTSTPVPQRPRAPPRGSLLQRLFSRRVPTVRVEQEEFISNPGRMVTFDNPAFDDSNITLLFEQDLDNVIMTGPYPDFNDIVSLSRPVYSRNVAGRVQVSRLGSRASIRTRSGTVIGPQSHFYKELSSIVPEDAIEMEVFGEHSGEATVLDGVASAPADDLVAVPLDDEAGPQDSIAEAHVTSEHVQVSYGTGLTELTVPGLDFFLPEKVPLVVLDLGTGVSVVYPGTHAGPPSVVPGQAPQVVLDVMGDGDYYLHPSLLWRKRRKRLYI